MRSGKLVEKLGITQAASYRKLRDLVKEGIVRKREGEGGIVLVELEPRFKRLVKSVIDSYKVEILGEKTVKPPEPPPTPPTKPSASRRFYDFFFPPAPSEPEREGYPFGVLRKPPSPPRSLRTAAYRLSSLLIFLTGTILLVYMAASGVPIQKPTHALGFLVLVIPLWILALWLFRRGSHSRIEYYR